MLELTMEFSSKSVARSSARRGTKDAWAEYVRRRWKINCVAAAQAEWDLTEGEAKGLVYGQASQPTIDKILDHHRGGFRLGLAILELRTQTALANFIETEAERAKHERTTWEERERHLARLEALARGRRSDAAGGDGRPS